MQRSCYRCGSPVEEHTTFCATCGAPQIRVTPPDAPANQPFTPTMPPDTPDSIQPPAVPVQPVPSRQIQWRKFWRIALPFSLMNGAALVFLGPYGIPVFFLGVVIAINRYRRYHPGPLLASHGARLGAFTGLLSFIVALGLGTLEVLRNTGEIRRQILLAIQQKTAATPDPRSQQVAQFLATDQGLMFLVIFTVIFLLVLCLALSGVVGTLTVVFSGNKQRR